MDRRLSHDRSRLNRWLFLALLLLLVPAGGAAGQAGALPLAEPDPELLPVGEAFRFRLERRARALRLEATAAPGYYLYRDRLQVQPHTPGLVLGEPLLPPGEARDDPQLGRVQVFRGRAVLELPVTAAPPGAGVLEVAVTSQGCPDLGECYQPDTRLLGANPPPGASPAAAAGTPGTGVLARLGQAFDGAAAQPAGSGSQQFLPVDEAFRVRAVRGEGATVAVRFDAAPGYYLYRSRMGFEAIDPPAAVVERVDLPPGKPKVDEWLGEQQVFYQGVTARVTLRGAGDGPLELAVAYQGCADAGLCYPPQQRVLAVGNGSGSASAGGAALPAPAAPGSGTLSETDRLAAALVSDALPWVLLSFFAAGLLLAFTPCVLPMVPILSAIIAGQQGPPSGRRGFALSAVYVLAMSLTYTLAGVAAGLFGQNLQALFQHPAVLVGFSAVFVALALAMFGLYQLQLPVALQTRLSALSHRQRGGSHAGVAAMGVLSALVVGPCVAAPLAAALIVIGSSGDPVRGGLALFALSLGMGVPLLLVGTFGTALLPRAGSWMALVRNAFGLMLLAVAIYLLSRLLPDAVTLALWAALAVLTAAVLALSGRGARRPGRMRLAGSLGALAYAAVLAVGAATGASDPLRPLDAVGRSAHAGLEFQRVKTVGEVERLVAAASREGRAVMLDFYADWCVSCKQMERDTFTDPGVQQALADTVLLQADVTAYDGEDQALLERFGLYGPPAILFFGNDGRERRRHRVIGYMAADAFGPHAARGVGSVGGVRTAQKL